MSLDRPRRAPRRLAACFAVLAGLLGGAVAHAAGGPSAGALAEPPGHFDPPERTSPLDVYGARFGQVASTELTLILRTYEPWEPAQVAPSPVSGLCVWLRNDAASTPGGRVCVVPDARATSGVSLRYTALDHDGKRIGIRNLTSPVRRPLPTMISTRFSPALLRLVPGNYLWHVRSVSGGIEDRLPNEGELPLEIALSTAPAAHARCFGAASRDPHHECVNKQLRQAVVPTPDDAVLAPNSPCTPLEVAKLVSPCEFGVPAADAGATIALIGDSHATHWRAALENVAQRHRWRGVSIARSGCPLSRTSPTLEPESRRLQCLRWNKQVPKWLTAHPEVHTVFVVGHSAAAIVNRNHRDVLSAKVDGYMAAWKALPESVRRIVVIRDTPLVGNGALECVRRAIAKHRDAGEHCAVKRKKALRTDAAVIAAHRLPGRRVRVIDMTHFFCGTKLCYPVVGGALVYKDDQHITEIFGTTLGPYLRQAISAL
ncbi:MAG: hypothetical protein QOE31_734 [Solirubrobacteraceae bacterium]|jgi:hypothetical protein|nr:hypothetical protein [Solirubrobacteraceae bacterium]